MKFSNVVIIALVALCAGLITYYGNITVIVGLIFSVILLCIALAIYFIPFFVAYYRRHPQTIAILVLNIFLGWTFVGWVASLVWSFTAVDKPAPERTS